MKNLYTTITLIFIVSMSCGQTKHVKIDTSKNHEVNYKKVLDLKLGDRFFFGYSNNVDLFRVVDFNETGVFVVFNFESDNENAHWFPLHDLYYSKNYKKLTTKNHK